MKTKFLIGALLGLFGFTTVFFRKPQKDFLKNIKQNEGAPALRKIGLHILLATGIYITVLLLALAIRHSLAGILAYFGFIVIPIALITGLTLLVIHGVKKEQQMASEENISN